MQVIKFTQDKREKNPYNEIKSLMDMETGMMTWEKYE